jgi:hypothetical protein
MNRSPYALYKILCSLFSILNLSANRKLKPDEVAVCLNGISKRRKLYFGKHSLPRSRLQFHSINI